MKLSFLLSTCYNKVITTLITLPFVISSVSANATVQNSLSNEVVQPYNMLKSGVIYTSLDASITDKSIIVNWVTAAEQNNSHFEVERSADMKNFKTVGLVLDGFTAEGTGKSYKFKENASIMQAGKVIYYRLKQFDNDGTATYSNIVTVGATAVSAVHSMQFSANPTTDNFTVRFNTTQSGSAVINIVSFSGQLLFSKQSNITKGTNSVQVAGFNNLAAGTYVASLSINGVITDSQKLVKE